MNLNIARGSIRGTAVPGSILNHQVTINDDDQIVTLAFDSAMSFTDSETETAHPVSVKLKLPDGGVLGAAVSVDVADTATGDGNTGC